MKRIFQFKNTSFSTIIIFICVITSTIIVSIDELWKKPEKVIIYDVVSYYSYLPATFIYKDWTFSFLDKDPEKQKYMWTLMTDDGKRVSKTTMGLAILYSPFFLIAHFLSIILGLNTEGYTSLYSSAILIGGLIYFFLGLYYLRKILSLFFDDKIVGYTLLLLGLGTNWLYYASIEAVMPHNFLVALMAAFIYYTIKWHEKPNIKWSLLLGLLTGLISLVRATNIVIVLFFIFYQVHDWRSLFDKIVFFLKRTPLILFITLISITVWLPQFLYWKITTGYYYYYAYQNETFFFNNPQIFNSLFSFRKGLFVYTPIILFAYLGLFFLFKDPLFKNFKLGILSFLVVNIYIISSWWCWWYGGTLGNRAFVESYAVAAMPMALFIQYILSQKQKIKITFTVLNFFLIFLQIFQIYQFNTHILHHDGMTAKSYWAIFLKTRLPAGYWEKIDIPDYHHAKLGVYVNIDSSIKLFKNAKRIICDVENIHPRNTFFLKTNYEQYGASKPKLRTNKKAFSGKYSIKLDKQRGGFDLILSKVFEGEKFKIQVKCLTQDKKCLLVIGNEWKGKIKVENFQSIPNSDWYLMEYELTVPKELENETLKVNCYNYGESPAYFDDLEIIRLE